MFWFDRVDTFFNTRKKNTQNPCYGIEVEVEHFTTLDAEDLLFNNKDIKNFVVHDDGSLYRGSEFVTKTPHTLNSIVREADILYSKLKETSATIGDKTSTHIHADVRNFNKAQLFSLFCLFAYYEDDWIEKLDTSRKNNRFCLTYRTCIEYFGKVLSSLRSADSSRIFFRSSHSNRYCGLNVDPIHTKGSVEFRFMQGNLDTEKLREWLEIIAKLLDVAKMFNTPKKMFQLYNMLRNHPLAFKRKFFGCEVMYPPNDNVLRAMTTYLDDEIFFAGDINYAIQI